LNLKERGLNLKNNQLQECGFCSGTGITHASLDYPCLAVERFCHECETGRSRTARLAEIVTLTLRRGQMKAA
jgi:hypothetical protein